MASFSSLAGARVVGLSGWEGMHMGVYGLFGINKPKM